jgi:hypothetical protein
MGELTALLRLAGDLSPGRFEITYAECVRGPDPLPRTAQRLQDVECLPLYSAAGHGSGMRRVEETFQRLRAHPPDAIVLSTFCAFFQFAPFPEASDALLEWARTSRIPLFALDPCGDSYVADIPPGVRVLLPVPFSYTLPPKPSQMLMAAPHHQQVPAREPSWLWIASPWMEHFPRLRAAELIAFKLLSRLGVPASTLTPIHGDHPFVAASHQIAGDSSPAALEAEIGRHSILMTANKRSVLAARAAAMGVTLVLIDPAKITPYPGYDPEVRQLVQMGYGIPDSPTPREFFDLSLSDPESALAQLQSIAEAHPGASLGHEPPSELVHLPRAETALMLASSGEPTSGGWH